MNNKLLYLLWIGVVSSRRSEKAVPETPPPKRVVSQWGYPYGWGLDMPNDDVENHKQIKAVKRGTLAVGRVCEVQGIVTDALL